MASAKRRASAQLHQRLNGSAGDRLLPICPVRGLDCAAKGKQAFTPLKDKRAMCPESSQPRRDPALDRVTNAGHCCGVSAVGMGGGDTIEGRIAPMAESSPKGRKLLDDTRFLCAAPDYLAAHDYIAWVDLAHMAFRPAKTTKPPP